MQPPKVVVPLENEKVKKGSPVLLKATITGNPTPTVRLYYVKRNISELLCLF
jgi:hypothetical protein